MLANAIRQEKEIKAMQIGGGEIKLSLFTDDIIIYIENLKEMTKILKLISNYSKVAEYKVNVQKSVSFLYTSNEQIYLESKNTIPFTLAPPQ